jgi:hypothetical protein
MSLWNESDTHRNARATFLWKSTESAPPRRILCGRKGGDPMSPEIEFLLSVAGVVLGLILAYVAFTRTKWASA